MPPAAVLLALALATLAAAPGRLAGARWPVRTPALALLLWQALALTAGLLAVEVALSVALVPYGRTDVGAVDGLLDGERTGAPWWSVLAAVAAGLVALRLVQVLVVAGATATRSRRRHRRLVDLLATRPPRLLGACVLDHDAPLAYCLPGLRPRVVVTSGALRTLTGPEVDAVLAHERAHAGQHHDLVVLPFTALLRALPWLRPVRAAAAEVTLLVELLADDRAARRHDRATLARALYKVAAGSTPACGLGAGGSGVLVRAGRLLDPPPPLPRTQVAAALLGAVAVASLPLLGLVLPLV